MQPVIRFISSAMALLLATFDPASPCTEQTILAGKVISLLHALTVLYREQQAENRPRAFISAPQTVSISVTPWHYLCRMEAEQRSYTWFT